MFRSIYLKSLREYRVGIFGWGLGMSLIVIATMASVSQLMSTPQAKAELVALAGQFAWAADPVAVDTVGGYATFKVGITVFLACVWALLVGSRMLRGEEDRGSLDVLLSAPRGRLRVVGEKVAAYWTALLGMALVIAVAIYAGGQRFEAEFGFDGALLFALDIALICAVIAGIALLLSQFTQERGPAAGWTGALLLLFIVLDMANRVFPDSGWVARLSPVYYYNLSKPLIPSVGASATGMLVLLGLAVGLSAFAAWLFVRRDIGATSALPRALRLPARAPRPATLPANDWSLRSVYLRSLRMIAMPTFWWTLILSAFAAWMLVVIKQIAAQINDLIASSPAMSALLAQLGGGTADLSATFLSAIFQFLPILMMAFVISQVGAWASDEEDGRLDLVLATPQSRSAVVLGRFAALSTATVAMGVVILAVTAASAAVGGVELDAANLAAATLGMIPLGILIGGIGYLAGGWLRTAADTGLLSFLLAAWFFLTFIGPDLSLPDSALRLSPLYYYGKPLVDGIPIANVAGLLAVGLVALAVGAYRFTRKDIAV